MTNNLSEKISIHSSTVRTPSMSQIYHADTEYFFPYRRAKNSQAFMEKLYFGKTPIPTWIPIKKTKNSTIRFGIIASDFLQEALDFEGVQFILSHESWRNIIKFSNLDFILIESTLEDCTGDWNLAQHPSSDNYKELLKIITEAKKYNIPTIYWQTGGKEYHDLYAPFAQNFDFIFCADHAECALFSAEGIQAGYLPPCIQPALANPFKLHEYYNSIHWKIVFDGWKDLERNPELWNTLSKISDKDFHIIESNALFFKTSIFGKSKEYPDYADCLHGCTTPEQRRTILKYTDIHITHSESINTSCKQRWLMLEAAACGTLPLYHGSFEDEDICQGIARECHTTDELIREIEQCQQNPRYHKCIAHLAWRKVNMEHTFSHRMRTLCQQIGIEHDWEEYPLVSMITPTYRKENIDSVIDVCAKQQYPHKEHIIITNGFKIPLNQQKSNKACPLTYLSIPEENFAGACLNMGFQIAKGEYVYRIDDDDIYGEHYILDTILNNRALDIDFWGKQFLYFINDQGIIQKKKVHKEFSNCISKIPVPPPAGCSFGGKKFFFAKYKFKNNLFGAADSGFQLHLTNLPYCVLMDEFNIIVYRSDNIHKHTWKINSIPVTGEEFQQRDIII